MPDSAPAPRRLVVLGPDAGAVARAVRELRQSGARVAGFVGQDDDEEVAREMATEMLGGLDEVVRVPSRR
ncbi:MAG: hypothetical protein M3N68_01285 [Actinomycetota bacterium]|nr:hypothetical protein [Actinomycetota bacterium]